MTAVTLKTYRRSQPYWCTSALLHFSLPPTRSNKPPTEGRHHSLVLSKVSAPERANLGKEGARFETDYVAGNITVEPTGVPSAERTRPKFAPKAAPERRKNPGNTEKSPKVPTTSRTDRGLRNQLPQPVEIVNSRTSGAHGSRRRTAARKHRGQSKP